MTKPILITLAVVLVVGLIGMFFIRRSCHHGKQSSEWIDKKTNYVNEKITRKLDLNETQKKRLAEITATLAERMKAIHSKRKAWHDSFLDEFKKDKLDGAAIDRSSKDIENEISETRKALVVALWQIEQYENLP